jgi:hypothetical protein
MRHDLKAALSLGLQTASTKRGRRASSIFRNWKLNQYNIKRG